MPKKKKTKKSKEVSMSLVSDRDWEAKNEARTLAEAEAIKGDKKRYSRAKKAAVQMAKDSEKETKALKRIAKK